MTKVSAAPRWRSGLVFLTVMSLAFGVVSVARAQESPGIGVFDEYQCWNPQAQWAGAAGTVGEPVLHYAGGGWVPESTLTVSWDGGSVEWITEEFFGDGIFDTFYFWGLSDHLGGFLNPPYPVTLTATGVPNGGTDPVDVSVGPVDDPGCLWNLEVAPGGSVPFNGAEFGMTWFASDTALDLTLEPGGTSLGSVTTDDGGMFDTIVTIPENTEPDAYTVRATGPDVFGSETLTWDMPIIVVMSSHEGPYWPEWAELEVWLYGDGYAALGWPEALHDSGQVVGYNLYQNGDTLVATIGHIEDEGYYGYFLEGLVVGNDYTFSVIAFDDEDLTSAALERSFTYQNPPYWDWEDQLTFSDISSTSATISWPAAISDHTTIAAYNVVIYNEDVWLQETVDGETLSYTFTDLDPDTVYEAQVTATDADGLGSSMALWGSFFTGDGPFWTPWASLDYWLGFGGAVELSWPPAGHNNNAVAGYYLYQDGELIATLDHEDDWWGWYLVEDLTLGQEYLFEVVAFDVDDLLSPALSAEFTYWEPPYFPDDAELVVTAVTSTSASLQWTPAISNHAEIDRYMVEWYSNEGGWDSVFVDGDTTTYTITDLVPDTVYEVYVAGFDTNDIVTNWWLWTMFYTGEGPFWPNWAEIYYDLFGPSSIELYWPDAMVHDGEIAGYELYLDGELIATVEYPNYIFEGAVNDTFYVFEVLAFDDQGRETEKLSVGIDYHQPLHFPEGAEIEISDLSTTSVTISWPDAISPVADLAGYEVVIIDMWGGEWYEVVGPDVTTLTFDGLTPATAHLAFVVAFDEMSNAAWLLQLFVTHPEDDPSVGAFDPSTGRWHLRSPDGSVVSFYFGVPGDRPVVGDWDGDGIDTPGLYRQSTGQVFLLNSIPDDGSAVIADLTFWYGIPGDIPIAGDWDNDGNDTIGIYRPSTGRVFIVNTHPGDGGAAVADHSYYFGDPADKPFAGDWDGDGVDTLGLHRETSGLVYFTNVHETSIADWEFYFGEPGDRMIAGGWNVYPGVDAVGVFRPSNGTWYFRMFNTDGIADYSFTWGESHWQPVAGTWNLSDVNPTGGTPATWTIDGTALEELVRSVVASLTGTEDRTKETPVRARVR